jgi:hypothetical protein
MAKSTIRSWVEMIGDVVSIIGAQVMIKTVNVGSDSRKFIDEHPVLVSDPKVLAKIKVGKKLGFAGIIRRVNNRTKLMLNAKRFSVNQTELKDRYLNTAGLAGHVVFTNYFNSDAGKKPMMTLGIGEPDQRGTAIYCSLWQDIASNWNSMFQGKEAEVQVVGYMRSREMTGANAGDSMYELVGSRKKSTILNLTAVKSGFEGYSTAENEAMMAFEFDEATIPGNLKLADKSGSGEIEQILF